MGPSPGEAAVAVVLFVVAVVAAVSVSERARFSEGSPLGWSSTSTAEDARTRPSMLSDDRGSCAHGTVPSQYLSSSFSPGHYHLTPESSQTWAHEYEFGDLQVEGSSRSVTAAAVEPVAPAF